MTKLGTLKAFPTPSELRQSVQEIKSLEQLPGLVAEQVSEALAPLLTIRQDVAQVLEHYNQVTKAQRSSLESMAMEISDRATKGMEAKAGVLDKTVQDLASQVQGLQTSMKAMQSSTQKLQALPAELTETAKHSSQLMQKEAKELMIATHNARPRFWMTLLQLCLAAILGAMLVAAGQAVLNRLLPPSELQQNADYAVKLWARATPEEQKWLTEIVSRPAR